MKLKIILKTIALFFIFITYNASAQLMPDTLVEDNSNTNSCAKYVNISTSLRLGYENGLNGGIEYENSLWGKVMLRPTLGAIHTERDLINGILADLSIGYGYPIIHKNNHTLFTNVYFSFLFYGLKTFKYANSGIFELEYRRRKNRTSFIIAPFIRYSSIEYSIHNTYDYTNDYSLGIRIGVAYSFEKSNTSG